MKSKGLNTNDLEEKMNVDNKPYFVHSSTKTIEEWEPRKKY